MRCMAFLGLIEENTHRERPGRGLQIARLLVDMPKEGNETLVCLISEHGKKEFFFTYPAVKKFFEDCVS